MIIALAWRLFLVCRCRSRRCLDGRYSYKSGQPKDREGGTIPRNPGRMASSRGRWRFACNGKMFWPASHLGMHLIIFRDGARIKNAEPMKLRKTRKTSPALACWDSVLVITIKLLVKHACAFDLEYGVRMGGSCIKDLINYKLSSPVPNLADICALSSVHKGVD